MAENSSTPPNMDAETVQELAVRMRNLFEEISSLQQFLAALIIVNTETDWTQALSDAWDGLVTWASDELDWDELFDRLAEYLPPVHAPPVVESPRQTDHQRRLFDDTD